VTNAQTISFCRRHLPHWTVADRSYFVTIRLKGSLPRAVAEELKREREALAGRKHSSGESEELRKSQFKRIEAILDSVQHGPRFLDIVPVSKIVFRGFKWLEESKGWLVHAATVMPNHLHLLMRHPEGKNGQLNRDLDIFKGFTAHEVNKHLDRVGKPFWMDENFDHWCRDDAKLRGAVRYIVMNPVKAGLVAQWQNWPWTTVSQAFLPDPGNSQAGMPDLQKIAMNTPNENRPEYRATEV